MMSLNRDTAICTARPLSPLQPTPAPTCHHWPVASPCYTVAPLWSQWRIQHLDLVTSVNHAMLLRKRTPTFNNRIDRTTFLAKAAIDAFCHINIISCCPSATIFSLLCFDCDG